MTIVLSVLELVAATVGLALTMMLGACALLIGRP